MRYLINRLLVLGVAALAIACGGGGSDTSIRIPITTVTVMGDSLADSGAFLIPGTTTSFKFTVQGTQSLVFPERVAQIYGVNSLCSYYQTADSGATFSLNAQTGCTNYAVGGGRINRIANPSLTATQYSIPAQLAAASASANYSATDLLIVDGGGNDVADLVTAYLNAATGGAAIVTYSNFLGTLLDPADVAAQLALGDDGFAAVGGMYTTALANMFADAITASALDKGAQHVVVLNMPGITNTPKFQLVLDSLAAAYGGGTTGAAARAQAEALFKSWMEGYNARLASRFAGDSRVALVDFYSAFNEQIASPAQFSLTNVSTPACPMTGTGSDGLPTYTFPTCTEAALSAAPPIGVSGADWWRSYGFADGFHPTPYGHQLLGQLVAKSLAIAGWL